MDGYIDGHGMGFYQNVMYILNKKTMKYQKMKINYALLMKKWLINAYEINLHA